MKKSRPTWLAAAKKGRTGKQHHSTLIGANVFSSYRHKIIDLRVEADHFFKQNSRQDQLEETVPSWRVSGKVVGFSK
jgi:hypothetical protein